MSLRMLIYHTLLYTTYRKPVISLILYPFRTHLPSPPLVEVSAGREALKFWYHVLPLWEIHAQPFLEEHITAMYPLLPTMKGVTAEMMFQAIKEMAQVYNRDDLSRRLGWLDTLMQRADMLPSIEKQTVKEYLEMFNQQSELDDLLEESTFLRKFSDRAVGKATIQEMQRAVMDVLQARFPALTDFAQEKVFQISQTEVLHFLVSRVAIAPNEDAIRLLLSNPVA